MKHYFAIILFFFSVASHAGVEVHTFKDAELEKRYKVLIEELRCLVCQNQNLADSNADLAKDLRQQVYEMLQAGKSNEEISRFMVDRYGDFVLYEPPFKTTTLFLWLGPGIILLIGLVVAVRNVYKRRQLAATKNEAVEISEAQKQKIRALLDDEESSQ